MESGRRGGRPAPKSFTTEDTCVISAYTSLAELITWQGPGTMFFTCMGKSTKPHVQDTGNPQCPL